MSSPEDNEILNLTRRSFRRNKRMLLSQKSEPSGFPEDHPLMSPDPFTGHEHFAVSYSPHYPKSPREPPSPAASVLGRIFSFSSSTSSSNGVSRSDSSRSKTGRKRPIRRMGSKNNKRRSSMVPAFGNSNTSYLDQFSATSEQSANYTSNSNLNQVITPRQQQVPPSPGPILLGCATPTTPQWENLPMQLSAKQRQKAVITVNSKTTEILIANDNLRRLFDLNRSSSSLIGRKLTDVFPSHRQLLDNQNGSTDNLKFFLQLEEDSDEEGKTALHSALFDENGQLKPVYGKPVDIHTTNNQISTVCLWSYPLTAMPSAVGKERKTSVMLMRSPSAYLPSSTNQTSPRQSTTAGTPLKSTTETKSESFQLNNTSLNCPQCGCPKVSPPLSGRELKVLREEDIPSNLNTTNTPSNQLNNRTPSHAPTAFTPEKARQEEEKRLDSANRNTIPTKTMVVQGELLNAGGSDDEDDEQKLGFVQRTFRNFNFHEQAATHHSNNENSSTHPTSNPLTIQTNTNNANRLNKFMCGSTPVITAGVSSPPMPSSETISASSSNGSSQQSVCHHQIQVQSHCCCKAASRPACAALNPHHDAQHVQNHVCNDAENCRWLILMNPINALHISVTLGAKGRIFRTDDALAAILGYDCTNRLFGTEIHRLIPELRTDVEMNSKVQQCCGCSIKHNGVPLTANVVVELDKDQNPMAFNLQLRSLASINGVVTITDAGVVYSSNENFLHELTGRGKTNEIMLITDLIPDFYESATIASLNADQSNGLRASESEKNGLSRVDETEESSNSSTNSHARHRTGERSNSVPTIQVGNFYGLIKHINGVLIPIRFDVTRLDMQSTPRLFAVYIGYERGIDYGINQRHDDENDQANNYTRQSSSSGAESDVETRILKLKGNEDDEFDDEAEGLQMHIQDVTLSALSDESNEAICGEYSTYYDTFQLIGNGTFGSVKLAARKDSGLLAVTKFVCKDKVLPESWVRSRTRSNRMIPIEVHLLETLNHQNIVKVLDVFENDKYYQLVMEKLGCGMDLFEFVESHPMLDEELTSYIFRQIVSSVEYLSNNGIVHRDIKDENVIIDSNFCCKLIDFGSAAYFGPNIVFSTFCGTMEYASPEVLIGNKYLGPEAEMWSLGILLYTLVFFTNPFRTPQETVHADFELPHKISDGLYQVISWLLRADPRYRATIMDITNHWWVQQPADPSKYKFRDVVKNSERARVSPPLYVSDLHNHLQNASSCGNLANNSMNNLDTAHQHQQPNESGVVSAR